MPNICLIHKIEKPCELCIQLDAANVARLEALPDGLPKPRKNRRWGTAEDIVLYVGDLSTAMMHLRIMREEHIDPDGPYYRGCENQPCTACVGYLDLKERYPDL